MWLAAGMIDRIDEAGAANGNGADKGGGGKIGRPTIGAARHGLVAATTATLRLRPCTSL